MHSLNWISFWLFPKKVKWQTIAEESQATNSGKKRTSGPFESGINWGEYADPIQLWGAVM